MMRHQICRFLLLGIVSALAANAVALPQSAPRKEQAVNSYYQKWMDEDVYWIISEEERDVFAKLTTEEEREAFIAQFWDRRDPDPASADNEFKIEHYRRILYANERFTAGISGWKTDRGMIYIRYGQPDRVVSKPTGGPYERERKEGGGFTSIFPIERWEYRHIEGVGDEHRTRVCRRQGRRPVRTHLRQAAQRRPAAFGKHGTHAGRARAGNDGRSRQQTGSRGRPALFRRLQRGLRRHGRFQSTRDKPLAQLTMSAALNRAPVIKYKDLETAVSARVSYGGLPFDIRQDFIRLTDYQVLVPVTIQISNEQMTFTRTMGIYHGGIQVFGRVTGLANQIEAMFEDEVMRDFSADEFEKAKSRSSVYQKRLILKPGVYKIDIAVKDLQSRRIGTVERRLEVPRFGEPKLQTSSILIASRIEPGTPDAATMNFILGDLKVVPKADDSFRSSEELGLYLQIYNFAVDAASSQPALRVEYSVAPKGKEPDIWRDSTSMMRFAGSYCRLARMINLSRLQPGSYQLRVRIRDSITGQVIETAAEFTVRM